MTIKIGERLPNATLRLLTPDGPKPVETKDYFAGKTVVLFGLPGAFTPTCHKNHLPGFIVNEERFKAKGVDKIAMTAVNDHHVLKAWADGNGDFAKAIGLDLLRLALRAGRRLGPCALPGRRRRRTREPRRTVRGLSGGPRLLSLARCNVLRWRASSSGFALRARMRIFRRPSGSAIKMAIERIKGLLRDIRGG